MNTFYLEGPGGLPGIQQTPSNQFIHTKKGFSFEGGAKFTTGTVDFTGSTVSGLTVSAAVPLNLTGANANALSVAAAGSNYALNIDTSTASAVTGLNLVSKAAAAGVALSVLSTGTNEALTLDAKGSGTIGINTVSTTAGQVTIGNSTAFGGAQLNGTLAVAVAAAGTILSSTIGGAAALSISKSGTTLVITDSSDNVRLSSGASLALNGTTKVTVQDGTAVPAGGSSVCAIKISSTANLGLYVGSGAPTVSAAQGSLYLRTDGSSTSTRAYINTDGATTWTAVTTAT